jgi:hypothetical protein
MANLSTDPVMQLDAALWLASIPYMTAQIVRADVRTGASVECYPTVEVT